MARERGLEDASVVFTIGHGTRGLGEFLQILTGARADVLVDVRRHPGSRRHPHFSRAQLELSLPAAGIAYEWWGDTLGGRRASGQVDQRHSAWRNASFRAYAAHMDTPEFRAALESLHARAATSRIVLMCAETLWWRCHRRLIADALTARGQEVVHLGAGTNRSHVLTDTARVLQDGRLLYDAPD